MTARNARHHVPPTQVLAGVKTTVDSVIEFRRLNSRIKIKLQLAESRQDPSPSTLSKSQALKRNES